MRGLLGLVLFVLSVAAGAVADSYLCVADQATGFYFDKESKTWAPTNYEVSVRKYIVARRKGKRYTWDVTVVGTKSPQFVCDDDIGEDDRILSCDVSDPKFIFDMKALRYTVARVYGYIVPADADEGDHFPFIEIGKCSPL